MRRHDSTSTKFDLRDDAVERFFEVARRAFLCGILIIEFSLEDLVRIARGPMRPAFERTFRAINDREQAKFILSYLQAEKIEFVRAANYLKRGSEACTGALGATGALMTIVVTAGIATPAVAAGLGLAGLLAMIGARISFGSAQAEAEANASAIGQMIENLRVPS